MSEGPIAGGGAAEAAATPAETQTAQTTTPDGQQQSIGTPNTSSDSSGQGQQGINPAWNPLLEALPTSLHHIVTPHLSQWDKGVQERFQELNARYQPYEAFAEQNIDPDTIAQALGLYQLLDTDPQKVFEAFLAQGFTVPEAQQAAAEVVSGQGQESESGSEFEDPAFDVKQSPEFQRLQQMVEAMAQSQVSAYEQQLNAEVESEIDQELAEVRQIAEQHGIHWNERAIVRIMSTDNVSAGDALRIYVTELRELATAAQQQPSPVVVGGGGGVPARPINRSELSGQDRRKLVAQMLEQSAANG